MVPSFFVPIRLNLLIILVLFIYDTGEGGNPVQRDLSLNFEKIRKNDVINIINKFNLIGTKNEGTIF
jgi:hypothetical protein